MLETIILALIVAKLKGYKIKPIFKSWHIYPVLVIEFIYLIIQINIFLENYSIIQHIKILETIYICSYLFIIIKYEQYISAVIGSIFISIGGMLNKFVIRANNGKMPVFPTLSYFTGYAKPDSFIKVNDIHILGDSSTKFKFLTDIIDVGYSVMSIGDIFIRLFVFIVIFNTIKHINTIKSI
ncbi:hypothetical protein FDG09_13015 [Clostridium sporogenes]|uniref:DUF5317 family protein n=1 Tax=Clostridium TaxID=1485 RepID=UPI0006ABD7B4|nr:MULTISPECIES: DUF5317 family protein [Clostridium]EJP6472625.1 DUF5317 family protein [Clostridium botulinum]KOR25698.1 membrane protein [Clostridium sp. L74]NFV13795.1 hypothetical protein [Clostridium sporogenes]